MLYDKLGFFVVYLLIIGLGIAIYFAIRPRVLGDFQRIAIGIAIGTICYFLISCAAEFHTWSESETVGETRVRRQHWLTKDTIDYSSWKDTETGNISMTGQSTKFGKNHGRWETTVYQKDPFRIDTFITYYFEGKEISAADWYQISNQGMEKIESRLGWILAVLMMLLWTLVYRILPTESTAYRQNEQILKQLECLKMATLSSYEAQYATAKALQIRADAAAEKRGEKSESTTLPSPVKVREILELWIDAKPPKAT